MPVSFITVGPASGIRAWHIVAILCWIDGWKDEWLDGWMHGRMNTKMNGWKDGEVGENDRKEKIKKGRIIKGRLINLKYRRMREI